MANTVTRRVLIDGPKEGYVHIYLKSDGAAGELTNQVVVQPADFSSQYPVPTTLTIMEIWYENVGFDSVLVWDASSPVPAWKVAGAASENHICFDKFGGLTNTKASGFTGKIFISTAGFTAATDEGSMIIRVRKD